MSIAQNTFQIFVPERRNENVPALFVPGVSPRPPQGWEWGEGWVEWTIADVAILDGDFCICPYEQISTVVATVELALSREQGSINIPGSGITLSTQPVSRANAKIIRDVSASRSHSEGRSVQDHREVVTSIALCARPVIDTVRAWTLHIAPPPARPVTAPGEHAVDCGTSDALERLNALDVKCRHFEAL